MAHTMLSTQTPIIDGNNMAGSPPYWDATITPGYNTLNPTWGNISNQTTQTLSDKDEPFQLVTLQGKMFTVELSLPEYEITQLKSTHGNDAFKYEIKKRLCSALVQKLYESDMIDFAMQQNMTDFNYSFRGRIYVTPKDQTQVVKILLDKQT